MKRRILSIVLTLLMLLTVIPLLPTTAAVPADHVIINQVYGRSDNTDAAISHSFIELYNPTDNPVSLNGWSLQYVKDGDGWNRLRLEGVINAKSSFLVRAFSSEGENSGTRYQINEFDQEWVGRQISNNCFKVALVNSTATLSVVDPSGLPGVIDFVGSEGTDAYEGRGPASEAISKQKTIRRVNFSDTDDNWFDFEMLDYRSTGISDAVLELVRPRSSFDGPWGTEDMTVPYPHLIINQAYARDAKLHSTADPVAISHSFIELYNPTNSPVDLDGWSLQYTKNGVSWKKVDLEGTIPARNSYLVRAHSADGKFSRYNISVFDLHWEQKIDNDTFKIALVNNDELLTRPKPTALDGVVDLLGARNTPPDDVVDFFEGKDPATGISKQRAARRIRFSDTDRNAVDFEALDYRSSGISNTKLAEVKPRSLADGMWGEDIEPPIIIPRDEQVVFSVPAGLYKQIISLAITTGYPGAVIRYTRDGSNPTASSTPYVSPIFITDRTSEANKLATYTNIVSDGNTYTRPGNLFKGTTIKARAFATNGTPLGDIFCNTYFVNPNMDTRYEGLPIISLTTPESNLFGSSGIYIYNNFNQQGSAWERPAHVEMFETDGSRVIAQDVGIRINGGSTRWGPQKSFRIYAKKSYDITKPKIDYDIFQGSDLDINGKPVTSYETILMRNGGNDVNQALMRDGIAQKLGKGLNFDYQDSRQCVAFINGEFWGLYYLRPRYEDSFFSDHYGIKKDEVALMRLGWACNNVPALQAAADQSDRNFYTEMYNHIVYNSMANATNYAKVQNYMDVDSYIDYFIYNIYMCNRDWPANNQSLWRRKVPVDLNQPAGRDGRFRWNLYDMDICYGIWWEHARADYNMLRVGLGDVRTGMTDEPWSTNMIKSLLNNPDFKAKFINRFCDLMNTQFKPEVLIAETNKMAGEIRATIPEHQHRWNTIHQYSGIGTWNGYVNHMIDFANDRPGYMNTHLRNKFGLRTLYTNTFKTDPAKGLLEVNGMLIDTGTLGVTDPALWTGNYYAGTIQTITAKPQTGQYFAGFEVKEDSTGNIRRYTAPTIRVTIPAGGVTIQAFYQGQTMSTPVASVKLNASSKTLTVGGTTTLTATVSPANATNKAVTWKSGNTAVATINSSGKVTAKAPGKATITVTTKDGNKTATCAVTVKPQKPASVKTKVMSAASVKITWGAVSGANGYEVRRATSKSGTYKAVKTVTGTSFTNTGLTAGKTYYYKIRAYKTVNGQKIYSAYSSIVSAKPKPLKVTGAKAVKAASGQAKISWSKQANVSGYQIVRA
ncbi:MAG: CotH kinase family protein, partial [Oscillospiraceae bacterium]|nr:CotH kinase family protein [Oscillospiraceae bacterium]